MRGELMTVGELAGPNWDVARRAWLRTRKNAAIGNSPSVVVELPMPCYERRRPQRQQGSETPGVTPRQREGE